MKIDVFKKRFLALSKDQQIVSVSEMKRAAGTDANIKKQHCRGIPEDQHATIIRAFKDLVIWCENSIN